VTIEHTSGPWLADREAGGFTIVDEADGRVIARLYDGRGTFPQSTFALTQYLYDGQHEANARLIAAAPDLLAALRSLIAGARPCTWDDEDDPGQHAAWIACDQAIAKATGAA
jgi:hypothetical protein